ncbi:MAG: O-antigen ligase family protein [Bacteroidetes bacterium]|nr:O-antigen ligase family protein [Bacteroidota bacterium]
MKFLKKNKTSSAKRPNQFLFYLFTGFIVVFLPFFYLREVWDQTLMPRLLAQSLFLWGFAISFLLAKFFQKFDFSILRFKIFPLLAAYFLATMISLVFACNSREGIFDVVKTFMFISLVILGTMLFLQTDKWAETLSVLVLCSAVISIVIGFLQYYLRVLQSPELFLPDGRPVIYAVDGIMSHKNLFSLSLLMMLPFIAYGIYSAKGGLKPAFVAAFILIFILIILLKTRAVWLGIIVSGTITMAILLLLADKFNIPGKWKNTLIAGLVIILFTGIVFAGSARMSSQNSFLRYLTSIADTKNVLNTGRLKTWSLTVNMIRDHYLTGVGAGNWQINAPAYYRGRFSEEEQLNWIRPHNDYLWVMSEKGIAGILLFLSVFALLIYYLFVIIAKSTYHDKMLSLFLLAGIVGYLVSSAFDFPYERPYHQSFLALYLISAVWMMHRIKPQASINIRRPLVAIPYLLLISFAVFYSYTTVRQEVYLRKAYAASEQHDGMKMLEYAREAESPLKNMDPLANPVASYLGKAFTELNDLPNALIAFREAYRVFPDKMKSIINLAKVNEKLKLYDESEQILKRGLNLYPDHPILKKQFGDLYFARGDYIRAYVTLRSIHGWENDSSLSMNVRFLEHQMGIGDVGPRDLITDSLSREEPFRNYISRIKNDPAWLEMIRKKALHKGITVNKMIILDAEFMVDQQTAYYRSRILTDHVWLESIRRKSIAEKKPVEEMIRLDARYMVIQRFNHYKSTLENDTVAFAILIKKAISGQKSLEETVRAEAEIRVEQEIKNGK